MTGDTDTLVDLLGRLADGGDRPAVRAFTESGEDVLTYAELDDTARRLAGGLRAHGVQTGEFVALYAPNSAAWVQARVGLMFAGAVAVSLDSDLDRDVLAQQLGDSATTRILTVRGHLDDLDAAGLLDGRDVWLLDAQPEEDARSWRNLLGPSLETLPRLAPDDTAALFYTSGTTGTPKGVPLTHRNIAGNLRAILAQDLIHADDRILLPLPLHHSYPFIVGLLVPLVVGATQVQPAGVSGPEIARALREGEIDIVVGVPRLYETLAVGLTDRLRTGGAVERVMYALLKLSGVLRRRLGVRWGRALLFPLHKRIAPNLRLMASGGAKLEGEVAWTLEAFGWMVLSGYGLVETASISSFNPPGRARIGSAGLPAPGVRIRIDHAAAPDAPDDQGEVQIQGPNVFPGYRNNPEANAGAFTDDGWYRSGDLGTFDADGYLHIVGRVKEMIVLPDGKNVAPDEVEAIYADSPYIREIAVLEQSGRLVGLVAPDLEALRGAGGRIEDLIRVSLAEQAPRLPAYKRLSDWAVVREALPRTQLGKYQRHKLPAILERAERGRWTHDGDWSKADEELIEGPRARRVWPWLKQKFPDRDLHPDTSPQLDLGIDSLGWVTLGLEIEERFGVALPESAVARVMTLRDLLHEIETAPESATGGGERRTQEMLAEAERWLAPRGPMTRTAARLLHALVRLLCRLIFRLKVDGLDKVPTRGPLVIAPNHVSDLDPVVLAAALDRAHIEHLVWSGDRARLFENAPGRLLARLARMFPVDDRAPGASLSVAAQVLSESRVLVWFPEEWRSPDGALQRFLPGIGRLLADSGAQAVPCYIDGTFEAMPRTARIPRPHRVTVRFGDPVTLETLGGREAGPETIASTLRDRLAALADERRTLPEG